MSAIYDIAGTSNDTFMINGKATFIQGSVPPQNYQGLDGDIYLQSGDNATIHIKKNGVWRNLSNEALPSITGDEDIGKFLYVDTLESFGLAELKIIDGAISTEVPAGSEGNALYAKMGGNDQFRIRVGGESDSGWVELATGDNGNEPIYIRQYTGNLSSNPEIKNTFTVLDKNGYTWLAKHPAASSSTDSLQVPSIGWINDSTKSINLVHRTGDETISGNKTFSSPINSSLVTSRYILGNQGNTIINSTASAGSYVMLAKMNSTNGFMTIGTYQKAFRLQYTSQDTVELPDSSNNKVDKSVTLLNEDGNTILAQNPEASNSQSSTQAVTIGWVNNPTLSTNVVHRSGDETIAGTKTFSSTIQGTALKALWADLAEYYEADNDYPKGTLMAFGGDKEVTIATDDCNAVVSTNPALIMNGNESFEHPCLLALVGRVPVRVIGKVNKFDYLQLSEIPGVAVALPFEDDFNFSNVIARALENKESEEEGLVLCVVKFEL